MLKIKDMVGKSSPPSIKVTFKRLFRRHEQTIRIGLPDELLGLKDIELIMARLEQDYQEIVCSEEFDRCRFIRLINMILDERVFYNPSNMEHFTFVRLRASSVS